MWGVRWAPQGGQLSLLLSLETLHTSLKFVSPQGRPPLARGPEQLPALPGSRRCLRALLSFTFVGFSFLGEKIIFTLFKKRRSWQSLCLSDADWNFPIFGVAGCKHELHQSSHLTLSNKMGQFQIISVHWNTQNAVRWKYLRVTVSQLYGCSFIMGKPALYQGDQDTVFLLIV